MKNGLRFAAIAVLAYGLTAPAAPPARAELDGACRERLMSLLTLGAIASHCRLADAAQRTKLKKAEDAAVSCTVAKAVKGEKESFLQALKTRFRPDALAGVKKVGCIDPVKAHYAAGLKNY